VAQLEYEPTAAARAITIEHEEGLVRVNVAMPHPYFPIPNWVGYFDVFSLIILPIWIVCAVISRTIKRTPVPSRAEFEIRPSHLTVKLRDPNNGEVTAQQYPRFAINEIRPNRYQKGLWIDITGHIKDTILTDVPAETLERLHRELMIALEREA
jgi:hypothetical protein